MSCYIKALSPSELQNCRQTFDGIKCIIIDEISMLGITVLMQINERLQEIFSVSEPFGGIDIIFCGDLRQLPPVRATPCYVSSYKKQENLLWLNLNYFPLKEIVRQSDVVFSSILTKVGSGDILSADEIKLIESCHKTRSWCNQKYESVVRLFYRNKSVEEHNLKALAREIPHKSVNKIIGCSCAMEEKKVRKEEAHKCKRSRRAFIYCVFTSWATLFNHN